MQPDVRTPESVEQMRRSIVMLAPRAWALRREEAEHLLAVLGVAPASRRDRRDAAAVPRPDTIGRGEAVRALRQ